MLTKVLSVTGLYTVALLLCPVPAAAQKSDFLDAFIAFHVAVSGDYGDEGPRAIAALDRMVASLAAWEQSHITSEAELTARGGITPAALALFHAEHGRFDRAARAIADAIAEGPASASLFALQGLLLEAAAQPAEAAATFAMTSLADPADPLAGYLSFSRIPFTAQRDELLPPLVAAFVAAAGGTTLPPASFGQFELISDAVSRTPVFSPAAYEEGVALFASGHFRDALARFRTSLAADPLFTDPGGRTAQVLTAAAALRENRGAAAIQRLGEVVATMPESSEAHRLLGVALRTVSNLPESIRQFEMAVRLAPRDERARLALGATLAEAGRLADAQRVLRETIEVLPRSGAARAILANVYQRQNRGADAIASLEDAASLTVIAGKAALYWKIAELASRYQDFERVITALSRRARLLPNEAHAHKELGFAYLRVGRGDEALVEFLLTTLLGVEEPDTVSAIGRIHLAAERYEAAEISLRRAVALNATNTQARYALGSTLIRLGKTAEGTQHLEEFRRQRATALDDARQQLKNRPEPGKQSP